MCGFVYVSNDDDFTCDDDGVCMCDGVMCV